ncbi:hypothetical protein M8C21_015253, partial [Ambrosia artemisiifolia]
TRPLTRETYSYINTHTNITFLSSNINRRIPTQNTFDWSQYSDSDLRMFPSTAASASSSGVFGSPKLFSQKKDDAFAPKTFNFTGTPNFGGTSTSPFHHTTPSLSSTALGFSSFNTIGSSSSNGFNGPHTTGLSSKCEQPHLSGQERGSRIAAYKTTAEAAFSRENLVSISAMPAYNAKSHEELRWEDYRFPGTASQGTASMSSTSVEPNLFKNTFPSVATGTTTWKYPGPLFTSPPPQFSPSATTFVTTATSAPSNSFNPFASAASNTVTSTASSVSFAPFNHNPFTHPFTSPSTHTSSLSSTSAAFTRVVDSTPSSVNVTSAPSNSFNPFTPRTNLVSPASTTFREAPFNPFAPGTAFTSAASTASSVSLAPLNHNPFTASSLSPHTSSSSPTFTSLTGVVATKPSSLNWPTPVVGPFTSNVTEAANSISVSPVSSGFTSTFNPPTTLFNFNPCVPSTPNCNGTTIGINGQCSVSQLSSSQVTNMENPSPAPSPFGTLPPKPHMFVDGSQSKQPIQYGISGIRIKEKPVPVKCSLLTARHLSGRIKLPVRKYDPKLSAPKVPYFSDTKEIPTTAYVPRENPRALVIGPEKWPLSATRDNIHEEELSGSTYENERDVPTEEKQLFTILDVPAKLKQPDYYTLPQISELEAKERAEPGYCSRVKDFVVGRHGYGSIKFLGETDVRKVDIETIVQFNNREVIVYMDESKKPPVGEGLNKAAEITLLNIKCFDKKTGMQHTDGSKINKYTEMLKKKADAQGAEFMSYDPVEGEWKFRVQHF